MVFSLQSEAATQNYRLILTENPSTSALIGWELIGGCPDSQRVYYDTVDHQQDTAAYAFRATITASNFHRGMENYFCHLRGLASGTKYYLIIGEDEGLSPRLIVQTFSQNKPNWSACWTSLELPQKLHDWQSITQQIYHHSPDFMLTDGLSNLSTESAWRKWLKFWQPITYENTLVPIVIAGTVSADIQYLFNLSSSKLRHYPIASKTSLVISAKNAKVKKRFWKSLADASQVLWYNPSSVEKLPTQVDLALTTFPHQETQLPNVFNFPNQQNIVLVSQQLEKLQIELPDETVLLEMF
ncbi:hypothetical protein [Tunicatimonas pelagia]|uniref:hypothetical protein n=1 Tax=Tunicatimonas pelagia TaxID=931531 RepID=UPI002666E3EB|nr:hypothetical protein [Tunicatimonas pelagia]WKN42482.1 hypothetical protein P0M28_25945 [Tunicatimonas pelagia]